MILLDTHAHIYSNDFDNDRDEMMKRSLDDGVADILMPAVDSSSHVAMLSVEQKYPDQCKAMMGLHPCSVKENYKDELKIVDDYLTQRKFIAVGETGLDFYWDLTYKEQQYESFHQQAVWALQYDIPIVIHSRNSTDECIQVISEHQKGKMKGVFHCFSGTTEQARKIIDLGFYLGIGGVLTFKNSGMDKVMNEIDMAHVVLETDAPYLAPVPFRGKRNEPAYIKYVAEKFSSIKGIETEEIARITKLNAQKLFGL